MQLPAWAPLVQVATISPRTLTLTTMRCTLATGYSAE